MVKSTLEGVGELQGTKNEDYWDYIVLNHKNRPSEFKDSQHPGVTVCLPGLIWSSLNSFIKTILKNKNNKILSNNQAKGVQ